MRLLKRRSAAAPESDDLDDDMREFVDALRSEYRLDEEPAGMSRKERKEYRRETQKIKDEMLSNLDAGYRQAAGMPPAKKRKRHG